MCPESNGWYLSYGLIWSGLCSSPNSGLKPDWKYNGQVSFRTYSVNDIGQEFEYNERLGSQSNTNFIAHLEFIIYKMTFN